MLRSSLLVKRDPQRFSQLSSLFMFLLVGFAVMVLMIDPIFLACKKRFAEVFDDYNPHNL